MNTLLMGTGGIDFGGQGDWSTGPGSRCQMEVTAEGLKDFLNALTSLMFGDFRIGLYQNDHKPLLGDHIHDYTPATFSGYAGLIILYGWTLGAMYGVRAKSFGTQLKWTHDGGPTNNLIYGYYVVDATGKLKFAERFCDGPIVVDRKGRHVKIDPSFETKNEREDD